MHDMVPIVDDDDLKQFDLHSDESLTKRYRAAREHVKTAHAPKPDSSAKVDKMSDELKDYVDKRDGGLLGDDIPLLG